MTTQPAVLVIAGTDSSGGAGLLRDLATLGDHDIHAVTSVTAITAQTGNKVVAVHHIPPEIITEQITAALSQKSLRAIKIGMLGTAATVEAVVRALQPVRNIPIVLDPVLRSTSGTVLLDKDGTDLLREKLLPLCRLVTPNLSEAGVLSGQPMSSKLDQQANAILVYGVAAVLIKGGHASGAEATDLLFDGFSPPIELSAPRVDFDKRGTGCTLASAVASNLANGSNLRLACEQAKNYLSRWFVAEG